MIPRAFSFSLSTEALTMEKHSRSAATWSNRWSVLVALLLLYGASLLISQANSFLINYKDYKRFKQEQNQIQIEDDGRKPLTFADVRNGTFVAEHKSIQWIQTPTYLTDDYGDYIVIKDSNYTLKSMLEPKNETVLFDLGSDIAFGNQSYHIESLEFNNDLSFGLIGCNKTQHWRHSTFGHYFVYSTADKKYWSITDDQISFAQWAPNSAKISYVKENNVYIYDLSSRETVQVTHDGGPEIFYGKPDWVYEEEVFGTDKAIWWSPNSQYLVILRSNDTTVPIYPLQYYTDENQYYPLVKDIKYPKAGFDNPVVDLIFYDVQNEQMVSLPKQDLFYNDEDIPNDERLITGVTWVGKSVLIRISNRSSDVMKIFVIPFNSDELKSKISRSYDYRGEKKWFEITFNTIPIPASEEFGRPNDGYIDIVDYEGYDHLVYFESAEDSEPKYIITKGDWEVVEGPCVFDYVKNKIYFTSTEKSSIERHVYSINLDGTEKNELTHGEGWFETSFSFGGRFLLLDYQGPQVPYQKLIDLHTSKEELFTSNNKLKKTLHSFNYSPIRYGNVTLDNGVAVNYKENLPLNFNPNKKYPMLFYVYGGPGSQLVSKTFSVGSFSSILATELGCVVITVDGRGTGFKGSKFRNIVRDNLGYHEVLDQVSAAKYWIDHRGYVDEERTAIWGWSYGGYMTLKTLEHDSGEVFKYGMSVAPVTNWKLYDSIYTERYMHKPQENEDGYSQAQVGNDVERFGNVKKFLVMHGTGDDNVHFQNTLKLIDKFDLSGLENYNLYVFPDSDHGIRWHNAGKIVYDRLFNWIKMAFDGSFDDEVYSLENSKKWNDEVQNKFVMDMVMPGLMR